jgi:hypothetical protein
VFIYILLEFSLLVDRTMPIRPMNYVACFSSELLKTEINDQLIAEIGELPVEEVEKLRAKDPCEAH